VGGANPLTPENQDALFVAGCDDATFARQGGAYLADFDRVAMSFPEAVMTAVQAIEAAVPGLKVLRVEPEDLVSAADVAKRTKRTRESVRLLIEGKRGPGHFPPPDIQLSGKRALWHWANVAAWFEYYLGESVSGAEGAGFIAALNGMLDFRRYRAAISPSPAIAVLDELVRSSGAGL
jgi:hypothetical protein